MIDKLTELEKERISSRMNLRVYWRELKRKRKGKEVGLKGTRYGEGIYKDRGCALYSKCLECPLERCKDDE